MEVIILMGIKHCGKSTQGRILSEKLNYNFYDVDDVILELNKKSPREIYSQSGEEAFKSAEEKACVFLKEKILASDKWAVIATGGGICNNPAALEVLHTLGKFIFLRAEEKVSLERILREVSQDENGNFTGLPAYIAKKNPHSLKEVKQIFHGFFIERTKLYKKIADVCVNLTDASKEENAGQVLEVV